MKKHLAALLLFLSYPTAQAATLPESQSNVLAMVAAFKCATYAEYANKKDRQKALFGYGINVGRAFLKAVDENGLTKQELEKIPIIVSMTVRSGGPSIDFILGRLFDAVTGYAFDDIVKKGGTGADLPAKDWITDSEAKKVIAMSKYDKENCWAIGPKE
jgi:hypothetical protein